MSKIAIVTGASSGIGSAAVVALAGRGVGSIMTFNGNAEGAERTAAEARALGVTAVPLRLDLSHSETFAAFRDQIAELLSKHWSSETFHYLVNNAGAAGGAPFSETTEEFFDHSVRVLLKGPYFLTQTLLPLLTDGGAIVNISSSSASPWCISEGYSVYASLKGGLNVLSRYMAKELSVRGIRVNSIAPGPTRTRLGGDAFEKFPDVIPPLVAQTALGRLGEASDVGDAIAALLADDCRWVTAQELEVSGGYRL